jgi:hypothetical protein
VLVYEHRWPISQLPFYDNSSGPNPCLDQCDFHVVRPDLESAALSRFCEPGTHAGMGGLAHSYLYSSMDREWCAERAERLLPRVRLVAGLGD